MYVTVSFVYPHENGSAEIFLRTAPECSMGEKKERQTRRLLIELQNMDTSLFRRRERYKGLSHA